MGHVTTPSPTVAGWLASLSRWLSRKGAFTILAMSISCLCLFFLAGALPDVQQQSTDSSFAHIDTTSLAGLPECPERRRNVTSPGIWNAAEARYQDLMDDKFTIAILAYKRPVMLDETLHFLTRERVPSLHEILVIWNDQDTPPPEDYIAANDVVVRFKTTPRNSMTMKFIPYPEYSTKAILLHDDDVHYELADMEFAFQTWRKRGQFQITGAFARCMDLDKEGDLPTYGCVDASYYNMVLTGLLFTHIAFLDYFSSSDPLATRLREYVDDVFDCDDIAFNYVAQMLSCEGPYQVTGQMRAFDAHPASSISAGPEHMAMRWKCARDFEGLFGYMPLKRTTEHLVRGAMGWR